MARGPNCPVARNSWEVIFWGLCSRVDYSGITVWKAKVRGIIALGAVSLGVIVQGNCI